MSDISSYFLLARRKLQFKLLFGDWACIVMALLISYTLKVYSVSGTLAWPLIVNRLDSIYVLTFLLYPALLHICDLYANIHYYHPVNLFFRIVMALVAGGLILTAVVFLLPPYLFGRTVFLLHLFILALFLTGWRLLVRWQKKSTQKKGLALIGSQDIVEAAKFEVERDQYSEFFLHKSIWTDSPHHCEKELKDISFSDLVENNAVQVLAVDPTFQFTNRQINEIFWLRNKYRLSIFDIFEFYQLHAGKVPIMLIDGRWLVSNPDFQGSSGIVYLKIKSSWTSFWSASLACALCRRRLPRPLSSSSPPRARSCFLRSAWDKTRSLLGATSSGPWSRTRRKRAGPGGRPRTTPGSPKLWRGLTPLTICFYTLFRLKFLLNRA